MYNTLMKVFITRKIPPIGVDLLKDKGYEVDISPHDRPLTQRELITCLKSKPYDAVLSLLTDKIDSEIFDAAPTVKIFANYAIGCDNFDLNEGKRRGISFSNTPHGGADCVAEHAWALILALTRRIVEGDTFTRQGKYIGWDPMLSPGMKVAGKTLGLVGAGHIGGEVAKIGARGFGMKVIYYDIKRNNDIESLSIAKFYPTVEEVLKEADIVSLHTPLLDSTRHLINAERLKMMKPSAYLINTSRGPVIDEIALIDALKKGIIKGAGLDVYENEPTLAPGLAELPNVVLTPHIASATLEAREDMSKIAAENIVDVLEGRRARNEV